jgi:hypothetical protein
MKHPGRFMPHQNCFLQKVSIKFFTNPPHSGTIVVREELGCFFPHFVMDEAFRSDRNNLRSMENHMKAILSSLAAVTMFCAVQAQTPISSVNAAGYIKVTLEAGKFSYLQVPFNKFDATE